jgi:hypothetical protein
MGQDQVQRGVLHCQDLILIGHDFKLPLKTVDDPNQVLPVQDTALAAGPQEECP